MKFASYPSPYRRSIHKTRAVDSKLPYLAIRTPGREFEMLVFGDAGYPLILFPTVHGPLLRRERPWDWIEPGSLVRQERKGERSIVLMG